MPDDSEFSLIRQYFSWPAPPGMLGVGDDCALLPVSSGCQLAVSTDMLIEGRHFLPDADPQALGHKALAVNLSDLAAMGARPLACTLALGLPRVDHAWLASFSAGFRRLATQAGCALVGGDTTRSPQGIVLGITVMGELRPDQALRRDAARPGDDIWVSGRLGAPDYALALLQGRLHAAPHVLAGVRPAHERPQPRLALGMRLAGMAHAAIDISDGLLQDLGHLLDASACGAELRYEDIPANPALESLDAGLRQGFLLSGGDEYELCFTAAPERAAAIRDAAAQCGVPVTRIGTVTAGGGLQLRAADGSLITSAQGGFDHFRDDRSG